MKIKLSFAQVLLLLTFLTGSLLHAQNLDEQTIRISLGHGEIFSTIRLQSFSGNWRLEFRPGKPPLNTMGTLLASAPESIATVSELLTEGEDVSIILVPKGMVARLSTEKDLDKGYGSIQIEGGELLSLEIPGKAPMILQGRVSVHYNENSLIVVNHIGIRQLIVACVSKICFSNEPEVLKAMIVAIRSKIGYEKEHPTHASPLYDRIDNDRSLPFDGCGINRELVDILTGMTSNRVLMYKNKLINPRFQNSCGGRISSAKEIYGVDDEPYHASQADIFEGKGSENCFHSPNFHWIIEIQKNELLDFLAVAYAAGADRIIAAWEPEKVDANGRISRVLLRGKKPKTVSGSEFLEKLQDHFGPNSIKSMKFNTENLRRTVIFRGMGSGDGVGMCLYGSDGLAKKSLKYDAILKFYYPGTEIK